MDFLDWLGVVGFAALVLTVFVCGFLIVAAAFHVGGGWGLLALIVVGALGLGTTLYLEGY